MNIAMVGAGYVGLVSGACFADFGFSVVCVDTDTERIEALKQGRIPIYEPGLQELIGKNVRTGQLAFTTDLSSAIKAADAVFVAVGTPSRRGDGHADLSYVFAAVKSIAELIERYTVIIIKSTVPVGTADAVEDIISTLRPDDLYSVVSNPEFLREGDAVDDFKRPDRVVVGVEDERAHAVMAQLYRPLTLNQAPIHYTDRRTSELIKYAANAFLATKITFINEMADLCEKTGANVQDLARGIGLDKRIGPKFLHAGPGYGGSCFPKDTLALIKTAQDFGAPTRIVETVAAVNDERKRAMGRKVITACGGDVRGKTIAILGLTFKPNTDDMREAPSIAIVQSLQEAGARIRAYDPVGMESAREVLRNVEYATDPYDCLSGAHAMVLVTEWDMLRGLDLKRVREALADPVVIDLRNVYRPDEMYRHGLRHISVGRRGAA